MSSVAALLLGDGRFPSGGHAHSGGLEPLADAGLIRDVATLEAFLEGRLFTAGSATASIAAAACSGIGSWSELQAETDARIASPAQRDASRAQGRQLLRAARAILGTPAQAKTGRPGRDPGPASASEGPEAALLSPDAAFLPAEDGSAHCTRRPVPSDRFASLEEGLPQGPHHAVVLGVAAAVAGLEPVDAARLAAYGSIAGPASAAVRLLGLDPFAVHAVLARLAPAVEAVAAEAAAAAERPLEDLPCPCAPMLDVAAERHLAMEVRLFAS